MAKKKVIILGGGVAGMSAAHELIERGFEVQVFERKIELPGGKARSVPVPDPDAGDHYNPLPGEHGFRFFPGFYKHVIDTMQRIPFPGNKNGVFDNLVPAPHVMLARKGYDPTVMLDRFPKSWADFKFLLHSLKLPEGLTHEEAEFFGMKVWQLMTSCKARRENDYERMGWWQFTEAEDKSPAYQSLLAGGLTRTLVAARAQTASTKTGGDIFLQLIFNMANPAIATDRILNGPTNQQWLFPWHEYLLKKGVDYRFLSEVRKIDCENGKITGVWIGKVDPKDTGPYDETAVD
ncbi:MAG: NAD(P)-binding protein, partial [Bacteroidetes bacterium]|nr:NAD(P)-binding protein [Bacteroidota bacterium]